MILAYRGFKELPSPRRPYIAHHVQTEMGDREFLSKWQLAFAVLLRETESTDRFEIQTLGESGTNDCTEVSTLSVT